MHSVSFQVLGVVMPGQFCVRRSEKRAVEEIDDSDQDFPGLGTFGGFPKLGVPCWGPQ